MSKEYPLSDSQFGIWLEEQRTAQSLRYNYAVGLNLDTSLDEAAWVDAVHRVWQAQDGWRMAVHEDDGNVYQRFDPNIQPAIFYRDLCHEADPAAAAEALVKTITAEPIPLDAPTFSFHLFRFSSSSSRITLVCHHIFGDGWCWMRLLNRLARIASGDRSEQLTQFLPIGPFLEKERRYLVSQDLAQDRDFWEQSLPNPPKPLVAVPDGESESHRSTYELSPRNRDTISKRCRAEDVTEFHYYLALMALFQARYFNRKEWVMTVPVLNREGLAERETVGHFIKVLPLRVNTAFDGSFWDFVRRLKTQIRDATKHRRFPMHRHTRAVEIGESMRSLAFSFLPYKGCGQPWLEPRHRQREAMVFTLFINREHKDSLIVLETRKDTIDPDQGQTMLDQFADQLQRIAEMPDRPANQVPLIPAHLSQLPARPQPEERRYGTIEERFAAIVQSQPDFCALEFGMESRSYRELDRDSRDLAGRLAAKIKPESRVGLAMEASIDFIVAAIAVIRAGGAYVPLDHDYPPQRIEEMCALADIDLILTREEPPPGLQNLPIEMISLAELPQTPSPFKPLIRNDLELTNIVFTSGTTGRPKPIALPALGLLRMVDACRDIGYFAQGMRLGRMGKLSFDLSNFEIWGTLLSGGTICNIPRRLLFQPNLFHRTLVSQRITHMILPTALFHHLVRETPDALKSLQALIVGGEPANPGLFRQAAAASPNTRIFNGYGPAECWVFCATHLIDPHGTGTRIPIGKELPGDDLWILDTEFQLLPDGAVGEIYVGGPGLGRGYLNRPEETADRFVPHPFRVGERLYRTGDLGRRLPDGTLDILGRTDHQVKIRGHRIELEHVETMLTEHPNIQEAAVLALADPVGDPFLAAFVVAPDTEKGELQADLAETMLPYMIPERIKVLDYLPHTPNGKVDRRVLATQVEPEPVPAPDEMPATELETQILNLWKERFQLEQVAPTAKFSEIGGNSLAAVYLASGVSRIANTKVSVSDIFRLGTVRGLATEIEARTQAVATRAVSQTERSFLLETVNDTTHPYRFASLFEGFAEVAAQYPDALALTDRTHRWTFAQVHRHALNLAESLVNRHGIQPQDRVGILADPSVVCSSTVLAVLAAGATYVPMSVAFPKPRLAHMIEDCDIKLIFHDPTVTPPVADTVPCIPFPSEQLRDEPSFIARPCDRYAPATVLYTSGSTGRPKGALLTHAGILRMAEDPRLLDLGPGDSMLQAGNFVFDVSCYEMFAPLLRGARTTIIPKDTLLQPEQLESLIRREGVTAACFTTAYFNLLVDLRPSLMPLLRHVHFGGEMCSPDHVRRALRAITAAGGETRIGNLYGPTETTTLATFATMTQLAEDVEAVAVGRPTINSSAYVLSETFEPLPPGVPGELFLGGDGLALGYLNRPKLTATCFVPNPFQPGARLYRTGDLAAWREDGQLVIKGRKDAQVKIRGHRIEPQEIAHQLERHPAIKSAFVLAFQGSAGKELAAFLIAPAQTHQPDPGSFLLEHLPAYMVPAKFIYLDVFPLTANGKIDARALAEHPLLHEEPIPLAPVSDQYPLSHAQRRLWFLSLSDEGSRAYNMPLTYRIEGALCPESLRKTWTDLRRRHPSLRTVFRADNGRPIQQILPETAFPLPFVVDDLRGRQQPESEVSRRFEQEAQTRFDLEKGPLWRLLLFRTGEQAWSLMLHLHHIISDGWSIEVTMDEQRMLYLHHLEGAPLSLKNNRIGYQDFASWEQGFDFTEMEHYWTAKLRNHAGPVPLPYDRAPSGLHYQGAYLSFTLDPEKTKRLRTLAATGRTTLPNTVLALWALALSRFSNQNRFNLGYADANRRHPDLTGLLGFFVNMLVLPVDFEDSHDFGQMLAHISDRVFSGLEHGLYPFDRLVEKLNPSRAVNTTNLINAVFGYQQFGDADRTHHSLLNPKGLFGPNTHVRSMFNQAFDHGTSKFDLTLFAFEHEQQLQFGLEYDTRVFEADTMTLLIHFFTTLAEQVTLQDRVADLNAHLRKQDPFATKTTDSPAQETELVTRFSRIARAQPQKPALCNGLAHYTYQEVDTLSDRFAAWLAPKLDQHPRVAVLTATGIDLGWVLLGIMKAGGTYVPLNPGLPHRRLARLMEATEAPVLVTDFAHQHQAEELLWTFPNLKHLFNIEADGHAVVERPGELGDVTLWDYVGTSAVDDIDAGGWQDSYTGKPFSREVMNEYGDNALGKLRPYLGPDKRVLEIGCSSGITMVRIAPLVGRYVGLDLSPRVLAHARAQAEEAGWRHVRLDCLEAVDLNLLNEGDFDVIVINSVIQCFPGYNYLRDVLKSCIAKLSATGILFLGDLMDLARKQEMITSLRGFLTYSPDAKTKTDFSNELFLCPEILADLAHDLPAIRKIAVSEKRPCAFDNELTRYRFDILLEIDREAQRPAFARVKARHDRTDLPARGTVQLQKQNQQALIHQAARHVIRLTQTGILNLVTDAGDVSIEPDDRVFLVHQPFEEVHLYELFGSLLNGATAVVAAEDVLAKGNLLTAVWHDQEVSVALLPTPDFHDLVTESPAAPATLRKLIIGGDRLDPAKVAAVQTACPSLKLVHAWGPTEGTVISTAVTLDRPYHQIPAGNPLAGTEILIVDQAGKPAATGIAGEILIGGAGLSPGYLDEQQPGDRFLQHGDSPDKQWFRTGIQGRKDVFGTLYLSQETPLATPPRTALSEEPPALAASEVDLAASIIRIWRRELNQPHIEAHHNFFEIGGHSLKAVRVLHRMQEALNLKIPLAVFFNHPTVSGLVRALQSRGDQAEWLMLSEDHPNLPDIFYIPPGMGQPLIFKGLAQRLSNRFNGVGMFYPSSRDTWTLETMTQSIFHGIMKRHRRGPVYLVGYSLGCNLAFQIAKNLEIHGHPVKIVLMDGLVLDGRQSFGDDRNYEMEQWLATWQFEDREDLAECLELCLEAIRGRKTLGSITGDLIAIEARDNPISTEMKAWDRFCEGEFIHLTLPGNHFTMLLEDNGNLDRVADLLEDKFR